MTKKIKKIKWYHKVGNAVMEFIAQLLQPGVPK